MAFQDWVPKSQHADLVSPPDGPPLHGRIGAVDVLRGTNNDLRRSDEV